MLQCERRNMKKMERHSQPREVICNEVVVHGAGRLEGQSASVHKHNLRARSLGTERRAPSATEVDHEATDEAQP